MFNNNYKISFLTVFFFFAFIGASFSATNYVYIAEGSETGDWHRVEGSIDTHDSVPGSYVYVPDGSEAGDFVYSDKPHDNTPVLAAASYIYVQDGSEAGDFVYLASNKETSEVSSLSNNTDSKSKQAEKSSTSSHFVYIAEGSEAGDWHLVENATEDTNLVTGSFVYVPDGSEAGEFVYSSEPRDLTPASTAGSFVYLQDGSEAGSFVYLPASETNNIADKNDSKICSKNC